MNAMLPMLRLDNLDREQLAHVVYAGLGDSADGQHDALMRALDAGEASVWITPEMGFWVLGVEERPQARTLVVHCCEGRGLVNVEARASLVELARRERCDFIRCQTRKRGVGRMAERVMGFECVGADDDGLTHYVRGVS